MTIKEILISILRELISIRKHLEQITHTHYNINDFEVIGGMKNE